MDRTALQSALPSTFKSEIENFSELENGQFSCTIRVNVANEEEWEIWKEEFSKNTNSRWNTRRTYPQVKRYTFLKQYHCHHSSFNKVREYTRHSELKQKKTDCGASMKVVIKKDTPDTRKKDPFVRVGLQGVVEISWCHNHSINSAHAMSFLPPDEKMRTEFERMFADSLSVAEAIRLHRGKLLESEDSEELLANSQRNPKESTVYNWFSSWRRDKLGDRTGVNKTQVLLERQEELAKNDTKLLFQEEPLAIAIMTPIMQRAHSLELASDIAFCDSTSSCDGEGHAITFVLAPSPCGAVPLGVIITECQDQKSYEAGFTLLKEAVGDEAFGGKGHPEFCKHLTAILKFFGERHPSFPPVSTVDRHKVACLALGDKAKPVEFCLPLSQVADCATSSAVV